MQVRCYLYRKVAPTHGLEILLGLDGGQSRDKVFCVDVRGSALIFSAYDNTFTRLESRTSDADKGRHLQLKRPQVHV